MAVGSADPFLFLRASVARVSYLPSWWPRSSWTRFVSYRLRSHLPRRTQHTVEYLHQAFSKPSPPRLLPPPCHGGAHTRECVCWPTSVSLDTRRRTDEKPGRGAEERCPSVRGDVPPFHPVRRDLLHLPQSRLAAPRRGGLRLLPIRPAAREPDAQRARGPCSFSLSDVAELQHPAAEDHDSRIRYHQRHGH